MTILHTRLRVLEEFTPWKHLQSTSVPIDYLSAVVYDKSSLNFGSEKSFTFTFHFPSLLTQKGLETHRCVLSIVATDALVQIQYPQC